MDFGVLVTCCTAGDMNKLCLVQLFESIKSNETELQNQYECPLYILTNTFCCISSICIIKSVSLFHECTPSCAFKRTNTSAHIERDTVTTQTLVYLSTTTATIYIIIIFTVCLLFSLCHFIIIVI